MGILNKKGLVFTFIAVILLSVLMLAFLVNINNRVQTETQTLNVKIETINSFVKSLNSSYLPDALRSSSNQVMLSLLDYESNKSEYADVDEYFKQVLESGYYQGKKQSGMFQDNLNYTLPYTLNEIKNLVGSQGIAFDYEPIDFNTLILKQKDSWSVEVIIKLSYSVTESSAEWNINEREVHSRLSVTNYRDPLYLVEARIGKINLSITKTPYADFSDINNFKDHIERAYFRDNPNAPDFLQRLNGNFAPSIYGIESLLDPVYYMNEKGYSNADYQYLSNVIGLCVEGMPINFRLDQAHLTYYQRVECSLPL